MPGTKITDADRKIINAKFICIVCHLLLCVPMQTSCGHLMCFVCLQTLLGGTCSKCPKDGTELKKEEVFSDIFTKRELNGLHLHCTNPGCPWHGTYEVLMETHSNACEHAFINCVHSECKTKFQRFHLGEHLENECEYRITKCEFCKSDVRFASIKNHISTSCLAAPVKCKYCKADVLRKEIKVHEEQSCEEISVACDFQSVGCNHNKVLKRKELRQHFKAGLVDHVWLLLQFVLNFFSQLKNFIPRAEFSGMMHMLREEVNEVRVGLTEKFVTLIEKIAGLERRIDGFESTRGVDPRVKTELQGLKNKVTELATGLSSSRERNINLERELQQKTSAIERLCGRLDLVDESLVLNTVKLTDLDLARGAPPIYHSYNGTLLWKIDAFQRKRQEAINGTKTALYSPHFYSCQYGYKMCAKIYMNGDGFGKGSHLSLFFVVMKSDYDALQTWPFQKKITMMLLDQGNGDHMIDAFHSDPQSSSFQRPNSNMNIASGSPLFMPIDSLNNRAYIKDDVMFIKIIVD